jgi:hypothetical protein
MFCMGVVPALVENVEPPLAAALIAREYDQVLANTPALPAVEQAVDVHASDGGGVGDGSRTDTYV